MPEDQLDDIASARAHGHAYANLRHALPPVLRVAKGASTKVGLATMGLGRYETWIVRYEGAAASITLATTPKFRFCAASNAATANFAIVKLDVHDGYRQVETVSEMEAFGREIQYPTKRLQPINTNRISGTAVEITPKDPLPPGQYLLVGPFSVEKFDFGVQ